MQSKLMSERLYYIYEICFDLFQQHKERCDKCDFDYRFIGTKYQTTKKIDRYIQQFLSDYIMKNWRIILNYKMKKSSSSIGLGKIHNPQTYSGDRTRLKYNLKLNVIGCSTLLHML